MDSQNAQDALSVTTTTSHSVPAPVFVYGALRSGTTLFRLILNTHSRIANPGEVDFLFDHLHRDPAHPDGWRYDLEALRCDRIFYNYPLDIPEGCDGLALLQHFIAQLGALDPGCQTLNVHRHPDKIAEILPKARFIHLLRDPRDVARSSIGMGWSGNSYYGVAHWIRTETSWAKAAIAPDRVLTVRFETLMGQIESELGRICDFLGVPYETGMLDYHHGTNFGPPDPSIAFGWKRKATPREIALVEGRLGPLLEACGYAPNGAPRDPGRFERLSLALDNRWHRWWFNTRRYGLGLFLATHAARAVGWRGLHDRLRQKQEDIRTRTRK